MDGYFGLRAVHPGVCEVDDGFTVKYIAGCQLVSSSISKRGQNTSSSLHLASSFQSLIELYYIWNSLFTTLVHKMFQLMKTKIRHTNIVLL